MTKTYPTKQELNKKRWYKIAVSIKWLIIVLALFSPIMADNGVWYIDGIISAVIWYFILSFLLYIVKLFVYGKPPKNIESDTINTK